MSFYIAEQGAGCKQIRHKKDNSTRNAGNATKFLITLLVSGNYLWLLIRNSRTLHC